MFGNTILLSAGQGVGLVSMAIWTIAVARYIGPGLYGFYAFAQAVVSVLAIFLGMGLDEITTRDVAQDGRLGCSYLVTFTGAKTLVATVVLGGFLVVMLRGDPAPTEVSVVVVVAAMGLIQSLTSLAAALLYAYEAMHLLVVGQSVNYVLTMTSGLLAIWLDRSFATILVLSLVASVVQLVLVLTFARRRLARSSPAGPVVQAPSEFLRVARRALPFLAVAVVSVLHSNMLIILLKTSRYSDVALGRFAAAQRLSMIILIVPSMVAQVLVPAFSRAYAEAPDRFTGMFERAYRYILFLSVPAAIGIAAVAPALLDLTYGDEFTAAGGTLRVLALVLIGAAAYVLGPALVAMDRQGVVARIHTVNLVAVGVVAYLLIPRFGAEGAAWAMVVGAVGSLALYSRILFATLDVGFPAAWVVKTAAAAGVTALACAAVVEHVHFLVVLLVVVPVTYLAVHLALRTLSGHDWQYVRSVLLPAKSPGP